MGTLPLDVWVMMVFSLLVFFGVSIWMLIYTLREEERKMRLLREEEAIDTHSPAALRELHAWIDAHPDDPDRAYAEATYRECVDALRLTDRHFHDWSPSDIDKLPPL